MGPQGKKRPASQTKVELSLIYLKLGLIQKPEIREKAKDYEDCYFQTKNQSR